MSICKQHLFECFGIEIEYMIVDSDSYEPLSVSHNLLMTAEGESVNELQLSDVAFSNELIGHHITVRTVDTIPNFQDIAKRLHRGTQKISDLLQTLGACLMSGAMHPFMDPSQSTKVWSEQNSETYEVYDKIFNVSRHGSANIQSTRLLLPFQGDEEFRQLHAAVRLVLPLIPALAAGSPIYDSTTHDSLDCRLVHYNSFHDSIHEVAGEIIPEIATGADQYSRDIFEPMRKAVKEQDPQGLLNPERLNARGAISLFQKNLIEIRLIDAQESPLANCSVLAIIAAAIQMVNGFTENREAIEMFPSEVLRSLFINSINQGEEALIKNVDYLKLFNIHTGQLSGAEFWAGLMDRTRITQTMPEAQDFCQVYNSEGTLATRLLKAFNLKKNSPVKESVSKKICKELIRSQQQNTILSSV